ncbi:MAG TPA: alpha-D-ribose 1-methylphosphonate 5-triphosphate diphosphatase [Streptosporangiaceae bacterium]
MTAADHATRHTAGHSARSWSLGVPPADYVLGHVRAVFADRVVDDARVVVRDGLIAEAGPHPAGFAADVDGSGLLCLPGLIDTHSDALEKERVPRPGAELPLDFALLSLEGKLRAAGITTVFHGAGFQHKTSSGLQRTVSTAAALCAAVADRAAVAAAPVDHRILYRLDARSAEGAAALRDQLDPDAGPGTGGAAPLVSHEDHTPGQGQYVDRRYMERYLRGTAGMTAQDAVTHVDELIEERDQYLPVLAENYAWLGGLAKAGRIRLVGHDPDSPEAIAALRDRGGSVAEFPTTVPAARAARDLGFPVVMGAPNVLRGGSHSGNVSAADLVTTGLVTTLASDYLPSGLLAAVFTLARSGLLPLPEAISLVTSGPAAVAGLSDRGRLEPGLRADLTLVEDTGSWPAVWATLRAA